MHLVAVFAEGKIAALECYVHEVSEDMTPDIMQFNSQRYIRINLI